MQNFGVTNKEYYGMLWYFLEQSIGNRFLEIELWQTEKKNKNEEMIVAVNAIYEIA